MSNKRPEVYIENKHKILGVKIGRRWYNQTHLTKQGIIKILLDDTPSGQIVSFWCNKLYTGIGWMGQPFWARYLKDCIVKHLTVKTIIDGKTVEY